MPVQELQQEAGALHPAGFSPVNPGELLCNASKMSSFALAAKSLPTVTVINDGGGGGGGGGVCVCPEPWMLLPCLVLLTVPGRPPAPQAGLATGVGRGVLLIRNTQIWVLFLLSCAPQVGLGRPRSLCRALSECPFTQLQRSSSLEIISINLSPRRSR